MFNDQGPFYHHLSCTLSGWEIEAEIIAVPEGWVVAGSGHGSRAVTPSVLPAFINLRVTGAHKALGPAPPAQGGGGRDVGRSWRQRALAADKSSGENKAGVS